MEERRAFLKTLQRRASADERHAANSHRPDAATIAAMVEEARGIAVAAADDVGLPFQRENLELLCAVKSNDPAAYQRIRAILKKIAGGACLRA